MPADKGKSKSLNISAQVSFYWKRINFIHANSTYIVSSSSSKHDNLPSYDLCITINACIIEWLVSNILILKIIC